MALAWIIETVAVACAVAAALLYVVLTFKHPFRTHWIVDRWLQWTRQVSASSSISAPEATVFQAVSGSDTALRTAAIAGTYTVIAAIVAGGFALAAKSVELSDRSAKDSLAASESLAQWRISSFYRDDLARIRSDAVAACDDPRKSIDATLENRLAHLFAAASSFGCPVPRVPPIDCRDMNAAISGLTFCRESHRD